MTEVRAIDSWATNGHMIADVAMLGYLDGRVLDATYGEGTFWKCWQPEILHTNDLHKPTAHNRYDYKNFLAFPDRMFDSVVFDPPYKLNGTPALTDEDARYGTGGRTSRVEVLEDIRLGALECYRVCNRYLLVKCMDQVEGGRVRWQTDLVTQAIEGAGGRKVDRFDFVSNGRPQPPDQPCKTCTGKGYWRQQDGENVVCTVCDGGGRTDRVQRTARRNSSTLLVFGRGR